MKLTALILLSACLAASANGHSQNVTLTLKDAPLEKVFAEIRKQTGYDFVYKTNVLEQARKVDVSVQNASLQQVLDLCFKDQPLTYKIFQSFIAVKSKDDPTNAEESLPPPPIDVKGRVINEKGEPVEGVTVTVKGTKNATATDINGVFELKGVDENAILVFTGVNIEANEVKVAGKTSLLANVKTKVTTGETIVVEANTGYQTIKPNEVNGSVVVIDNKTLNQQTGTNILQRLDGVTSGLFFNVGKSNGNPQNTTNISIRGLSTINGPLDPLIILDNFIFEGDINNINPNDVENVTVLKDAAAASIWGARAGNGVIVITTKKGRFNQKLKIDFNSTITVQEKPDLYYLRQMSSSDYIDVEQMLFNQGYFDGQISFEPHVALTPALEVFLKRRNGLIAPIDSANMINALKQIDSRDGFTKYFYKKPLTQQYSLNLRGGSGNIAWLVSSAYDRNINNLDATYNKVNLRIENTYRPFKKLNLTTGVYYTNSQSTSGALPYNSISANGRNVPYLKYADGNGNSLSFSHFYRDAYTDTAGNGKLLDWKYYPLEDYKHTKTVVGIEEIIANVGLNYEIFKSLNFNLLYQYQRQQSNSETNSDLESFFTRNYINLFSQIDPSTGVVKHIVPVGDILNLSNGNLISQNFRGQLNYNKDWNSHSLSAIVGGEIREAERSGNSQTLYGYREDPLSYGAVDLVNSYPTYITGNPQTIGNPPFLIHTVNRFVSAYLNFSYSFKQRYTVSGSFRGDGSNIFGVSTNDKWKPLWSAGAGWNISKEKFYSISWLPDLRVKTTIGYSGNVDASRSALAVAEYGTNDITNLPQAAITIINNPSLRWEQSRQWNIGVDFSSKKQIISGSIEYYTKKGTDLYGPTPYDYTAWGRTSQIIKNVANMKGKGVDIILQSVILNKTFKWSNQFLFNYNASKTTAYFDPSAQLTFTILGGGGSIIPVIGKPLYSIAAYKWGGLDASGNPQGFLNGQLSTDYQAIANEALQKGAENIKYIGSATPSFFGSMINTLSWKQLSVSFNLSYKVGYYFVKPSIRYGALVNSGIGHSDYEKRWKNPGDELTTNVPSFTYPTDSYRDDFYSSSEINVVKGDHIRLQYVAFSYSFDKVKSIRKLFTNLQAYINVANLGIVWKSNKEGIDPDYPSSIRPTRSFAFGVKAIF